ncbi:hypothetical protein CYMTET_29892 [Cymbomonas tetramitiformis]|uniref:16S rRNA (uracil(1498)-N(3))-methyltransferase n=1 Tax=Cymbomonas tetramitiformis TaxID=36881 RepID=A0AAE0FJW9_9CHLO|nr:hypothetical protein CYMTET_29892 [Cymbomonas tetramitiformis]
MHVVQRLSNIFSVPKVFTPRLCGKLQVRCLNRVLFEKHEVEADGCTVLLPSSDKRARHIEKVLLVQPCLAATSASSPADAIAATSEKTIKVGLIDGDRGNAIRQPPAATDGDRMRLLCCFQNQSEPGIPSELPVDILLAAPRTKQLKRMLPMLSQLGIRKLYLTNACRVEKAYLKSGVATEPEAIRELLVEGLSQARPPPPWGT